MFLRFPPSHAAFSDLTLRLCSVKGSQMGEWLRSSTSYGLTSYGCQAFDKEKHPISIWNIYEIYMKYIYIYEIYDINDGYTERILSQLSYFDTFSSMWSLHHLPRSSEAAGKWKPHPTQIWRFGYTVVLCGCEGWLIFSHTCPATLESATISLGFISHWSTSERLRYHLVMTNNLPWKISMFNR